MSDTTVKTVAQQMHEAASGLFISEIARTARMRYATVHTALRGVADVKISTAQRIIRACETLRAKPQQRRRKKKRGG